MGKQETDRFSEDTKNSSSIYLESALFGMILIMSED
jgi:hypothetical protein